MTLTFLIFFGLIMVGTIFACINFAHLYRHREIGTLAIPSILVLGSLLLATVIYATYTLVVYVRLI